MDKRSAIFSERRWTSSDGLSLFCRDYPGASGAALLPVVCLHGLTRNGSDFEDVAPVIASFGRRVIVPDVRGRGHSQWDKNSSNYIPRVYARDIVEMLDSLGISRAVFLGTSMGGIIMMMLALRHRHRIAAAILNDVGPEVAPEGIARIKAYVGKPVELNVWADAVAYVKRINEAALPHLKQKDWERFAERAFEKTGGPPKLRYDPGISAPLKRGNATALTFVAWRLFRRLTKGRPTLIVRGEASDILSRPIAAKMAAIRPTIELVEVPGVGHAPMLDEPASIAAIETFLSRVP